MSGEIKPVRDNSKLKADIAELIRVQVIILKAIAEIEAHLEEDFIEPGEYHGLSFE